MEKGLSRVRTHWLRNFSVINPVSGFMILRILFSVRELVTQFSSDQADGSIGVSHEEISRKQL